MSSFKNLVAEIKQVAKKKQHTIIGITGYGGSGKSYLANQLKDHFSINDDQVVRIDNLYGQNPRGPNIFDQSDWNLIGDILQESSAGKRLRYQGKDHKGKILFFDEELPPVVIFEGIRLIQPKFSQYFDISVWIDCPQDLAVTRAKNRDRSQGENEETVGRWDTDWGPKDKKYFDTFRPDKLADFIYKDYQ